MYLKVAADLREHMEIVHTSEYPSFINSLLKCFVELLKNRLAPQVNERQNGSHDGIELLNGGFWWGACPRG